jgi:hypothetical protein
VSARDASPFNPRTVLGMLLFGALAFIATLYFTGAGATGGTDNNGGNHAAGRGLNGYAAFAQLLGKQGYKVSLSRSPAQLASRSLLVLTPPLAADPDKLNRIINRRRLAGPTIVILPKWLAAKIRASAEVKAEPGWVVLFGAVAPKWARDLIEKDSFKPEIDKLAGDDAHWNGMGLGGSFPDSGRVMSVKAKNLVPLVRDRAGRTLAGYWDDAGDYPLLDEAADVNPAQNRKVDENLWPVVIVAEPDLVNNYGFADQDRALLSLAIVRATMERHDLPIVFDLTLDGLGSSKNLLTLAFSPPFLAATLCLILAALVIGWRGFRRFGPPLADTPVFAFGKRQLAVNGAALIQRSRRLRLLGAPYAAIQRTRIGRLLGLRGSDNPARTEAEIDRVLEARGLDPHAFTGPAEALRNARGRHELLRHAHALKQLERTLAS